MKSHTLLTLIVFLSVSFPCTSQECIPQIRTLSDTVFHTGDRIELRKLHFNLSGGQSVRTEPLILLDSLTLILDKDSSLEIEIAHHTDIRGSEQANLALSEKRAQRVFEYLLRKGVLESRMSNRGAGESESLIKPEVIEKETVSDKREALHAINRRTEIIFK